jgi:hypothetical protein
MNSNERSLNYKVVDLVEIYNFIVEFTSIRIYIKSYDFLRYVIERFFQILDLNIMLTI